MKKLKIKYGKYSSSDAMPCLKSQQYKFIPGQQTCVNLTTANCTCWETINKLEKERILHRNKCIYKIFWSVNLEGQILSFACVNTRQQRALPFCVLAARILAWLFMGLVQTKQTNHPFARKKENIQIYAQPRESIGFWHGDLYSNKVFIYWFPLFVSFKPGTQTKVKGN